MYAVGCGFVTCLLYEAEIYIVVLLLVSSGILLLRGVDFVARLFSACRDECVEPLRHL